eukprot:11778964-Ditylum_brightwellii.AAC.1
MISVANFLAASADADCFSSSKFDLNVQPIALELLDSAKIQSSLSILPSMMSTHSVMIFAIPTTIVSSMYPSNFPSGSAGTIMPALFAWAKYMPLSKSFGVKALIFSMWGELSVSGFQDLHCNRSFARSGMISMSKHHEKGQKEPPKVSLKESSTMMQTM